MASLNANVEILVGRTSHAGFAIEDRLVSRAPFTVLTVRVIEEVLRARLALLCLVVKVFGEVA